MSTRDRAPGPLRDNAFAVLGLSPEASRREVESAAHRLRAQVQLGIASASYYPCPATGRPRPLDEELLRESLRRLRDPQLRAREELWWLVARRWAEALTADQART